MIAPHGGRLVNRTVDERKKERLLDEAADMQTVTISRSTVKDLQNIAHGSYSPLTGFMDENNFNKVLRDKTLEDGTVWTVPIILDVSSETAAQLNTGERIALQDEEGTILAVMDLEEIFDIDKESAVKHLYGTDSRDHPGVEMYLEKGEKALAGDITLLRDGFTAFSQFNLRPAETRVLFKEKGWDTVVGFQTRNAPHRGHEYLQRSALEHVDAILIHPKIGAKKVGDYRDEVILEAYKSLIKHYYPDKAAMSIFTAKMRYMGPREAVFDAIVRKNYGCTHFIVGRDHAGVGDFYDEFAAQAIFDEFGSLGIEPMFYGYAFYSKKHGEYVSEDTADLEDDEMIAPSGTKIRGLLQEGKTPPETMMRPEVAETITQFDEPLVTDRRRER